MSSSLVPFYDRFHIFHPVLGSSFAALAHLSRIGAFAVAMKTVLTLNALFPCLPSRSSAKNFADRQCFGTRSVIKIHEEKKVRAANNCTRTSVLPLRSLRGRSAETLRLRPEILPFHLQS